MLPSEYVKEHQDKLMADPERYIVLLRQMNVLHCVWHVELQQEIARLKVENSNLRQAAADGTDVN